MSSEMDWENEIDFKEEYENEVDEDIEEDEDLEEIEESEEYEEPEDFEEIEEFEEDEDLEEYEESEEDEEFEEIEDEEFEQVEEPEKTVEIIQPSNRTALFIDGTLTDYKFAEKIEKAAKQQGDLSFVKIYRTTSEKNWNSKLNDFTVEAQSIDVDDKQKNEQIKNNIFSYCDNIDIFCITTNANFFEEVILELKSLGKKVVLISTWSNASNKISKASDVFVQLRAASAPVKAKSQNNNKPKKKVQTLPPTPKSVGVAYIDGNSISPKHAEQIIEFAKTKDKVNFICVFTVKGNDKAKKWSKKAEEFGFQNICLEKNTKKSDFMARLSENMMIQLSDKNFVCFATDDKVFEKKVKEIHKSGKQVVILSENEPSPKLMKVCDEFYDLKNNQLYTNYEYTYKKCAINAALFIDGENITHEYANLILSKAWEQGNLNLNIGGVYCREDDRATKPWKLKAQVFKLKTNQVKGKAAKNKVDNALIADALKCLKENDNITTFCIASHDKDYAKTIMKLRKAGKRVCVIGKLDKASDEMRFICDEFIPI